MDPFTERCPECDSREHRDCRLSFDDFVAGMGTEADVEANAAADDDERHNARTCDCDDCKDKRDYYADLELDRRRDDDRERGQ